MWKSSNELFIYVYFYPWLVEVLWISLRPQQIFAACVFDPTSKLFFVLVCIVQSFC